MKNSIKQIYLSLDDSLPETARKAIARILEEEGGYVVHEADKGQETKYGITKRWYPDVDIANLTINEAANIYYWDYWFKNKCHLLPPEIALVFFDCAVNQGSNFASKSLQQVLGVTDDGIIGPQTTDAAAAAPQLILLAKYIKLRCQRYTDIATKDPAQKVFLKGWINRALDILVECQAIALGVDNA